MQESGFEGLGRERRASEALLAEVHVYNFASSTLTCSEGGTYGKACSLDSALVGRGEALKD